MDAVNYWAQVSWNDQRENDTFDIVTAWGSAFHEINPVSGEMWTATLPTGEVTVFTQTDYNSKYQSAVNDYLRAQSASVTFADQNWPCP